jgi:Cys-rich repeat protein
MTGIDAPVSGSDLFQKPGLMLGLAFDLSTAPKLADIGFTAKVLSNRQENHFVLGAGVSYFPWASESKFGLDVSAGNNFVHSNIMGGYDFIRNRPQISGGWSSTRKQYTPIPASGPKSCTKDSDCPSGQVCSVATFTCV